MFFQLSYEFFPPKTPEGLSKLTQTAALLAETNPQFFSVTFGAGGSTSRGTLEAAQTLQKKTPVGIVPHLSCVGMSIEKIKEILFHYQSLGLNRLVVLRGDLPSGMGQLGELKFAYELIKLIRKETGDFFHIDVAAYPETHPQAKNAFQDILNLKLKFDAGADSAITQYFYNADAYFYFRDACIKKQIILPIVPGIMPITQFTNLVRFSEVCGAEIPRWIFKRLEFYGDDVQSIKQFGMEIVHQLCERLLAGGVPGLHFYTLNHADAVVPIIQALKDQLPMKRRETLAVVDSY